MQSKMTMVKLDDNNKYYIYVLCSSLLQMKHFDQVA